MQLRVVSVSPWTGWLDAGPGWAGLVSCLCLWVKGDILFTIVCAHRHQPSPSPAPAPLIPTQSVSHLTAAQFWPWLTSRYLSRITLSVDQQQNIHGSVAVVLVWCGVVWWWVLGGVPHVISSRVLANFLPGPRLPTLSLFVCPCKRLWNTSDDEKSKSLLSPFKRIASEQFCCFQHYYGDVDL